jgi:tripartite-type tricarboxylate transporter receptor subunit TctC
MKCFTAIAPAFLLSTVAATGWAQPAEYPHKSILFMVPQAAGGSTDTLARLIGQRLGDGLGVTVVIENRPGANGIIGTEAALKAAPNGATLVVSGTGIMAINPSLYPKLSYDPVRNFAPVANFGYSTSVLVAHPSLPVKTIADVIALAKKKPGAIKYASAGVGSSPHLSAALFQHMSGVDVLHVPYKGSTPGVTATITGETEIMFTGVASALSFIKAGRLRPISINGPRRSPALPTTPTAGESGLPGFEADFWIGLFAPAGVPRPLITRLNTEVNRILTADGMRERLSELGVDAVPGTPEQFGELLARDIDRWAKAVKAAGLKGE